jgi:hypothetical protein
MNSNVPSRERLTDLTGDSTYLGLDAEGNDHHWYGVRMTAWIVDDDGAVRMPQRVGHLGDYVSHVRAVCGWDELRYDDRALAEIATDAVETAEVQG